LAYRLERQAILSYDRGPTYTIASYRTPSSVFGVLGVFQVGKTCPHDNTKDVKAMCEASGTVARNGASSGTRRIPFGPRRLFGNKNPKPTISQPVPDCKPKPTHRSDCEKVSFQAGSDRSTGISQRRVETED
jgi:hypothetical protein